jgi:hypothetical protein
VAVAGKPDPAPAAASAALYAALGQLPVSGRGPKHVITPGGFARVETPIRWDFPVGWQSRSEDFWRLTSYAEPAVRSIMSWPVCERAEYIGVRLITIGIDVYGQDDDRHPLAELIAACDPFTEKIVRWTGKSYPTPSQEKRLFQVADLKSHVLIHERRRILLLGCHDLNMFSPRSTANQVKGSNRNKRCLAMKRVVRKFKPDIVLHHPHATDSPNIWSVAWAGMRMFKNVRKWASGIARYNENGDECRGRMAAILKATRSSDRDVADIVIPGR